MPANGTEVLSRKFFCFNELIAEEIGSLLFRDIHRQYGWGRRGKEVEGRFLGMEGGGGDEGRDKTTLVSKRWR